MVDVLVAGGAMEPMMQMAAMMAAERSNCMKLSVASKLSVAAPLVTVPVATMPNLLEHQPLVTVPLTTKPTVQTTAVVSDFSPRCRRRCSNFESPS